MALALSTPFSLHSFQSQNRTNNSGSLSFVLAFPFSELRVRTNWNSGYQLGYMLLTHSWHGSFVLVAVYLFLRWLHFE